jgi:pyridoxamine 5'-phosphate oxidase
MNLNDIRQEYLQNELTVSSLNTDPIQQLNAWFNQAIKSELSYVNAANLATVNLDGSPSSRIILIKDITDSGITFFTDYRSEKAINIESNNRVCINIFWKELDRQVRMLGTTKKISSTQNKKYFQSRPKESQISATASMQSSEVTKENLYKEVENLTSKYKDYESLPCPDSWGGYEILISEYEFWQGRPNRLHDRFKYIQENNLWSIKRISP